MSENLFEGSIDDILAEINKEENEEINNTNKEDSFENLRVPEEPVITDKIKEQIENPYIFQETLDQIQSVDEYSWARGKMGLDFGVEWMNDAFRGLNPGLHLIAGGPNVGKSSILLQLMWNIIENNREGTEDKPRIPYCMYFSLDDTANELMPRLIALDQLITINEASFPKSLESPKMIKRREEGLKTLRSNVEYFTMRDADKGTTIEYIEETVKEYQRVLETSFPDKYQVVVFIDNFHDVQVADDKYFEDNKRYDHIADRLTAIANENNVPLLCSAEFRKVNVYKRPSMDDVKSTGKIAYQAKAIMLLYNEFGVLNESSDIYWELADEGNPELTRKMPIVEFNVAKNKMNSFKGTQFMEFIPEMAHMRPVRDEDRDYYFQQMNS